MARSIRKGKSHLVSMPWWLLYFYLLTFSGGLAAKGFTVS